MTRRRAARSALRLAIVAVLRKLLPPRALFRLLGVPAGTVSIGQIEQIAVYGPSSKTMPAPGTVDETLHAKFVPGSDPFYRRSGWFFERAYVVSVPQGVSRATGVTLTRSGHVVDLGPGLSAAPSTYRDFYQPLSRPRRIDDVVVTLTTYWDSNYFHWLFDVLPRLHLVERTNLKPRWIYAPLRHAFQRDTLRALGYGPDMIIDAASVPHVTAPTLILPSLPGTPGVMPEWACRFLRERLVSQTPPAPAAPQRIYISRAGARNRRIVNEPRLLELLQRYGFATVRLESMRFEDQVRVFSSARCIVAPHGAGLANLLFCERGASVLEILPATDVNVCYWLLSQQASLSYHYVLSSAGGAGTDLDVDLDKLERTLDAALGSCAVEADVSV